MCPLLLESRWPLQKARPRNSRALRPSAPYASTQVDFPVSTSSVGRAYERMTLRDMSTSPEESTAITRLQQRQPGRGRVPTLSTEKIQHSANVAQVAGRLATIHPSLGLDPEEAWHAGALHDVAKQSVLARRSEHGAVGARMLEGEGRLPTEWIDAIRHHSTGTHAMTPHQKVLLIADSISADRGNSKELRAIRRAALYNPDKALRMLLTAHHNASIRGYDPEDVRSGLKFRAFQADTEALNGFRYFDQHGRRVRNLAPTSAAALAGEAPHRSQLRQWQQMGVESNPLQEGYRVHLDLYSPEVRNVVGNVLFQLERASPKSRGIIMANWMTNRHDRQAQLFRAYLPSLMPLFRVRYGGALLDAGQIKKRSGSLKHFKEIANGIDAQAKLMNAHSDENIDHLREFFDDDMWQSIRKNGVGKDVFSRNRYNTFKRRKLKKGMDSIRDRIANAPSFSDILNMLDDDIPDHDAHDFVRRALPHTRHSTDEEYD